MKVGPIEYFNNSSTSSYSIVRSTIHEDFWTRNLIKFEGEMIEYPFMGPKQQFHVQPHGINIQVQINFPAQSIYESPSTNP